MNLEDTGALATTLTELLIHAFIVYGIVVDDVMCTTARRIANYGIIPVLLLLKVTSDDKGGMSMPMTVNNKQSLAADSSLAVFVQERAQIGLELM
jgi:hypothetical protein